MTTTRFNPDAIAAASAEAKTLAAEEPKLRAQIAEISAKARRDAEGMSVQDLKNSILSRPIIRPTGKAEWVEVYVKQEVNDDGAYATLAQLRRDAYLDGVIAEELNDMMREAAIAKDKEAAIASYPLSTRLDSMESNIIIQHVGGWAERLLTQHQDGTAFRTAVQKAMVRAMRVALRGSTTIGTTPQEVQAARRFQDRLAYIVPEFPITSREL